MSQEPLDLGRIISETAEADKPSRVVLPDEHRDFGLHLDVHRLKCIQDEMEHLRDNHDLRLEYVGRIFWLVAVWLVCVVLCVTISGFGLCGFRLSDTVLVAFISSTTVNVVGLFVLVAKWMFPSGRPAAEHKELLGRLHSLRADSK